MVVEVSAALWPCVQVFVVWPASVAFAELAIVLVRVLAALEAWRYAPQWSFPCLAAAERVAGCLPLP